MLKMTMKYSVLALTVWGVSACTAPRVSGAVIFHQATGPPPSISTTDGMVRGGNSL